MPHIRAATHALANIEAPAVVFVGEVHDQLSYHLNQLAVIIALKKRGLKVAVGMEMIQTPFQQPLDDYINGRIDFVTMLDRSEYFERWRYDPRLYQPIFQYARRHRLPMVALNTPRELTERVSAVGIEGLDQSERAALPEKLAPLAPQYRALLERVFKEHEDSSDMDLERFIDVQRSWDETMGLKSTEFVKDNADHVLVVLAGVQHVAHGYGIPSRVRLDTGLRGIIILSEKERSEIPEGADVFLDLKDEALPKSGRLGVLIESSGDGAVITGFAEHSPAEKAGAVQGDVIVQINDRPVERFEDIKLALWDKLPGDPVRVELRRSHDAQMQLSFKLY